MKGCDDIWGEPAHGKDPAYARSWVARSDEPNACLVALGRHRADLVIDTA
ncbi:hypothetical protein [Streptomyces sp. NPDC001389]